ncbi:MAG TPA: CRISPR system precrRNA processing endoribonuclease RAMP protein Cas6, partial [Ktedonobacteraceae bacterium]|nr:CRISPR system precrRNA processing endoribonuclease RAMP protein Cas6 [Ktedonobacteraceae bacterium]
MESSSLFAHHLQVSATVSEQLELNEHAGAALRGAFFEALWGRFCVNKQAPACADCPLVNACPVSSLVAPLRNEAPRGRDVPRPYAIRPPVEHARTLTPGDRFSFGLTLFGSCLDLFPYVAMALRLMTQSGIGRRTQENNWRRGHFTVDKIQAVNLLSGETKPVQASGSNHVSVPDLPTTWNDAETFAATLPSDRVTLHFLTPLRLTDQQKLVKHALLRPLVERLLERHDFLAREYGGQPFACDERNQLIEQAAAAEVVHDALCWEDVSSYSRRQGKSTPIGGLMGTMTFGGTLRPLLPLLA